MMTVIQIHYDQLTVHFFIYITSSRSKTEYRSKLMVTGALRGVERGLEKTRTFSELETRTSIFFVAPEAMYLTYLC